MKMGMNLIKNIFIFIYNIFIYKYIHTLLSPIISLVPLDLKFIADTEFISVFY